MAISRNNGEEWEHDRFRSEVCMSTNPKADPAPSNRDKKAQSSTGQTKKNVDLFRTLPSYLQSPPRQECFHATTHDPPKEKPAPAISGWTTITTAAAPSVPQPLSTDRMALSGPSTETSAPASAPPLAGASQIKHANGSRTYERHGSLKATVSRRSRFVETVFSRNSPY